MKKVFKLLIKEGGILIIYTIKTISKKLRTFQHIEFSDENIHLKKI